MIDLTQFNDKSSKNTKKWLWLGAGGISILLISGIVILALSSQKPRQTARIITHSDLKIQTMIDGKKQFVDDRPVDYSYVSQLIKETPQTTEVNESATLSSKPTHHTPMVPPALPQQTHSKTPRNLNQSSFSAPASGSRKRLLIPISTILSARLVQDAGSNRSKQTVMATISQSLDSWSDISGAKLIGRASTYPQSDRLFISFTRLILSNGKEYRISAQAMDTHRDKGIPAIVENKHTEDILTVLGGASVDIASTAINAMTSGYGGAIVEKTGDKAITNIDTKRELTVKRGQALFVFFDEALTQ